MAIKIMKSLAALRTRKREKRSRPVVADWPQHFAKSVASNAAKHMSSTLEGSHLRETSVALFHRSEIHAGKMLGSGGFSDVHEIESFECCWKQPQNELQCQKADLEKSVRDGHGTCRYALKHLKPTLKDPTTICMAAADLGMEAHLLASLDHPNLVKIHGGSMGGMDSYAQDCRSDGYFLILDRLYGTLQDRIEEWRRNPPKYHTQRCALFQEKVKIGAQIASALAYLHEQNIIFRDVKPENVGFDADGNVKLFDLGLAREVPQGVSNDVYLMSGNIGTRRYMAPECAEHFPYGLKADVYSWAIMFYEMLGVDGSSGDVLTQDEVSEQHPTVPQEWPKALRDLMEQSWHKDQRERPTMKQVHTRLSNMGRLALTLRAQEDKAVPSSGHTSAASSVCSDSTPEQQ
eukprot:CAMPEP_0116822542 /NCGR_PEP_ID=MMETSP0418-20121206/328_1 /TAXON_ID=1158023 /ORGANISM="Astrosyne radiata, Strain 13vi08-1A" /LENGTH=403 /DNA_ID=CAMNT_0004450671 /DNA_START=1599 /DNA_END=2810 /DNA_ORIENTATION=-